jgi:hypothetical protein
MAIGFLKVVKKRRRIMNISNYIIESESGILSDNFRNLSQKEIEALELAKKIFLDKYLNGYIFIGDSDRNKYKNLSPLEIEALENAKERLEMDCELESEQVWLEIEIMGY